MATRFWNERFGFDSWQKQEYFSLSPLLDELWGLHSFLSLWPKQLGREDDIVSKLRMYGQSFLLLDCIRFN
jgi:hypothetical protein